MPAMEEVLSAMAEQPNPVIPRVSRRTDGFNRADVVSAFQSAFEIMGGVNRLALWAHANPDKFYPLYAKLLPSTTQVLGDAGALEIIHRIAPTALDRHEPIDVEARVLDTSEPAYEDTDECRKSNSNTNQDGTSLPSMQGTFDGPSLSHTVEPARQSPPSTT